jgi:hypothetical protein
VQGGWSHLVRELGASDLHTLSYHVVAKLWVSAVGTSELRLRLLSVVFFAATLPFAWHLFRRFLTSNGAVVALLLVCTSPVVLENAITARSYEMLLFLSVVTTELFFTALEGEAAFPWVMYAALGTTMVYTHLTGVFVVFSHFVVLLLSKDRFRRLTPYASMFVIGVSLIPIGVAQHRASRSGTEWLGGASLGAFVTLARDLTGFWVLSAVLILAVVVAIAKMPALFRDADKRLWALLLVPAGSLIAVSPYRAFLGGRYWMVVIVPACAVMGDVVDRVSKERGTRIVAGVFVAALVVSGSWFGVTRGTETMQNWRGVAEILVTQGEEGDRVVFPNSADRSAVDYYVARGAPILPTAAYPAGDWGALGLTELWPPLDIDVDTVRAGVHGASRVWVIEGRGEAPALDPVASDALRAEGFVETRTIKLEKDVLVRLFVSNS